MDSLTVVTPTYHPEPIGTPHYARDLVRWFAGQGWDVRVVTAQPFYPQFERYPGYGRHRRSDEVDGIPVLRVPTVVPPRGQAIGRAVNELNFAVQAAVRGPSRTTPYVLSLSPGTPWAVAAANAFRARGGHHVALVHDVQSGLASALGMAPRFTHATMRRNERWSLDRADVVAVLTPAMGDALRSLGVQRPIHDVPLWSTVEPVQHPPPASRSVQYSGNFGVKQGVALLLPFAAALERRDASIGLVLRGAGPRFDEVQAELQAAGLANVVFRPPVPSEELPGALASSPVHLVLQAPGSAEFAMPSKLVNALCVGSSVIAVAEGTSPLAKLAGNLAGVHHVEPYDLGAAADLAVRLLDDPQLDAVRQHTAAAAQETFSRDAVLGRLAELLVAGRR